MTATTKTAPITAISKYRALVLVKAIELGWNHVQLSTGTDEFTKGDEQITVAWGSTQMVGFGHFKANALVTQAKGEVKGKLQRLQTSLGEEMAITKKWRALKDDEVVALEKLATATFKVREPKA